VAMDSPPWKVKDVASKVERRCIHLPMCNGWKVIEGVVCPIVVVVDVGPGRILIGQIVPAPSGAEDISEVPGGGERQIVQIRVVSLVFH
jgi:hypothetical protein